MIVNHPPSKRSKYEQLFAVSERFYTELAKQPGDFAVKQCQNWEKAKLFYADALASKKATRSQIAAGLRQGLRETPRILDSMPGPARKAAMRALAAAFQTECPDFLLQDKDRMVKIRTRKSIRTEAEFYLVRHQIDLLEETEKSTELAELYALLDQYEAR